MKRFGLVLLAGVFPLGALACERHPDPVLDRLDEIDDRLQAIERNIGGGGPAERQPTAGADAPEPDREAQRPDEPDPDAVYAVPVGDSPQIGPDDAKVTMIEAFEFACPFCYRVNPTVHELLDEYGDDLRVVRKNFIVHPQLATTPALAACAADQQGQYEEMRELIWEEGFADDRNLGEDNMFRIAENLGLNMERFEADMEGDACRAQIEEDQEVLRQVGTRGTPNFYINGRPIAGAREIDAFREIIDEELAKAQDRIDEEGIDPADYYAEYVIERGQESL